MHLLVLLTKHRSASEPITTFLAVILSEVFEAKDLASYYRRRSLNQFPINTGVLSFNQAQRQVASSSVL